MVTFTANKGLGLPQVGGDNAAWGPPINANSSILDASLGGSVTIPLSSVSGIITLLASNYQNTFITFTGAITQTTVVQFPNVGSFYTVMNQTTGAFTVVLQTVALGQVIGCPPSAPQDVFTDGANFHFKGLPHVGAYWDYAGASVPAWVSACSIPPYLNCDGSAFSAGTYPALATILGGATLPDFRGRTRAYLNQGTGRMSAGSGGVDGNTLFAAGGVDAGAIAQGHIPNYNLTVNDSGHTHGVPLQNSLGGTPAGGATQVGHGVVTDLGFTGISVNSAGGNVPFPKMQPTTVGGLTLIRAG